MVGSPTVHLGGVPERNVGLYGCSSDLGQDLSHSVEPLLQYRILVRLPRQRIVIADRVLVGKELLRLHGSNELVIGVAVRRNWTPEPWW